MVHSKITISFLHVKNAAEMKDAEIFFPDWQKLPHRRSRCGGGRKSLALSQGLSLKSPWGLEWRLTMHLYSNNPLPLETAIPKRLLLNIVPAFQTARELLLCTQGAESSLHTLLIW